MAAAVLIFGVLLLFFVVDQFTDTDTKPHCFVLESIGQAVCWYEYLLFLSKLFIFIIY